MNSFKPHPLLRGGQLQTLAGQLLPKPPPPAPYETLCVTLPDGDRTNLHINHATRLADSPQAPAPVAVLMHGLGGCSESTYILRITRKLNELGYSVVRFNHRGCGHGAGQLARGIYHAGRIEDLHASLVAVATRFPNRAILPVAFSLSGNILLKLLGDRTALRDLSACTRAMAVCPPVDLEQCSLALDHRSNWHIDRYYTTRLIATAREQHRRFPDGPPPVFPKMMSLRIFDDVYTAPKAGFKNRSAYYDGSSAKHVAHALSTQTTILAAADDPIIPVESFAGVRFSSAVELRMEESGGHMGFIGARLTAFGDRRWMDEAVVDWVRG